jgi:hypothetical protein
MLFVTNAAFWRRVFNVAGNDFILSSIFNVFIISPHRIRYCKNANDNYQHATAASSTNFRNSTHVITLHVKEFSSSFGFLKCSILWEVKLLKALAFKKRKVGIIRNRLCITINLFTSA